MNKDNWDKFCNVFNLDVKVTVPKRVTKDDIILTLLDDGDFIFKSGNSHTKMNLKFLKDSASDEKIKLMDEVLFNPVREYIKKQDAEAVEEGK